MEKQVNPERLKELLDASDAEEARGGNSLPTTYSGLRTDVLLKIHLLPYLIPLKSERHLAYELRERPVLQHAVGIETANQGVPTRATLWHFRMRHLPLFRTMVIRRLALMYLAATKLGIQVPYVKAEHSNVEEAQFVDRIEVGKPPTVVQISQPPAIFQDDVNEQTRFGFMRNEPTIAHGSKKHWLYHFAGLPRLVTFWNVNHVVTTEFAPPDWLRDPYGAPIDLSGTFGIPRKLPYTACTVIVSEPGERNVLLSKRLIGSGAGEFSLPGGKAFKGESIWDCAARELKEETGLHLIDARPVSAHQVNVTGYPTVYSVGILATLWQGTPRKKEHLANSDWRWFSLDRLPPNLFFPTKTVLEDYVANTFPSLDWEEIEENDRNLWSHTSSAD